MARRLDVAGLQPNWSGDVLDLVVDFVNYVFVPAYAMTAERALAAVVATPLGFVIVVTGSLYFADRWMKTARTIIFAAFPRVWNVASFYLVVVSPRPGSLQLSIVAAVDH